ncbi:MAG: hypothetical protein KME20_09675 [Kaiparowitsia implicata GSE-PSE-MK54-09C]|jgi:hypothetical protein|nr:hypothetical protein [Kaiparowitsia implicata GSE-PSE-MK54-09C]
MICVPLWASSAPPSEAAHSLLLTQSPAYPNRETLRHLVIGSPDGVQGTINRLHLLQYAERLEWSRLCPIPPSGILITPAQGEVFSLLRRDRPTPF